MFKISLLRPIASVGLALTLGGCFYSWPEHGRGGFAEFRDTASSIEEERTAMLRSSLEGERSRLADLRSRYGGARAPAHLVEAELLAVRVQREIAGGLTDDAHYDLQRLSVNILQIEGLIARLATDLPPPVQTAQMDTEK